MTRAGGCDVIGCNRPARVIVVPPATAPWVRRVCKECAPSFEKASR